MKLSKKLYETLRWFNWIVLPATATLISALNAAWSFGLPIEQILATFSAIEVFIGVVLGISKYNNDKESN